MTLLNYLDTENPVPNCVHNPVSCLTTQPIYTMKSSEPPTSSLVASARMLNCTRGHIGICAVVLMFMMSTVVWKQTDLIAVRLPSFEQQTPKTLDSNRTTSPNGTLDRFWSANGECMKDLSHWEKPADISKIMGLVFYGRRQSVSILDCYLKVCRVTPYHVTMK